MNSPIFRDIPRWNNFKIPFKLKEELLLDWLLGLSKQRSRDACLLILQFLQTLNKTELPAKIRLSFLKCSHEYFKQYMNDLEGSCLDASLPLSAKEQDYAEIVVWNYLTLTEGFFISAQNSNARTDELFSLYMSCYCLGQAYLYTAAVYKSPCKFFWQLSYQVFVWAEKYKLLETKINNDDLKHICLKDMFAQLFIFHVCDTSQFRPRDMQTIFKFLAEVCDDFAVYKLSDIKFQTKVLNISYIHAIKNNFSNSGSDLAEQMNERQDLFVFDLDEKNPPTMFNQNFIFNKPSLRYFTAISVVKKLDSILDKGEKWSGILKSINQELFGRVVKTLESKKTRKYNRLEDSQVMQGVVGFDNIISFLYKVSCKNKTITHPVSAEKPTSYEELKTYADRTKPQMGAIDGGFFEMDFDIHSVRDNAIWDNNNTEVDIANRPVSLKKISIFNSSAYGYSVYWTEDRNAKAKVSDIFALISEDKKRLEVAIIRRISMITEGQYRFGAEVLGFESEVVMITHADNQRGASWGIFIPGIKALKRADTLIYPIGSFQLVDLVYIYKSNKKIKASITKELNATSAIVHAELDCSFSL